MFLVVLLVQGRVPVLVLALLVLLVVVVPTAAIARTKVLMMPLVFL